MTESGWVRIGLRILTWIVLGFLYLPLLLVAINAFNVSGFMLPAHAGRAPARG